MLSSNAFDEAPTCIRPGSPLPSPVSRENALQARRPSGVTRPARAFLNELGLRKALDRHPIEFAPPLGRAPEADRPRHRLPYWTPFMREEKDAELLAAFRARSEQG